MRPPTPPYDQGLLRQLLAGALPEPTVVTQGLPLRVNAPGAAHLSRLVETLPPSLLPHLDESLRAVLWRDSDWAWPHGQSSWRGIDPAWIHGHPDLLRAHPGLLGVLACVPNGRVREAAVEVLDHVDSTLALGLLLVRANDWVGPVRERARRALGQRLHSGTVAAWAWNLALVDRLASVERAPDLELVAQVHALLRTPGAQEAVRTAAVAPDPLTRLSILRLVSREPDFAGSAWARLFARDPSPHLRREVVQVVPLAWLPGSLTDMDAAVREIALTRLLLEAPHEQAEEAARVALLDPRSGFRALAQYTLRSWGRDVRGLYLAAETGALSPTDLAGYLAGLGEVGQREDAERVRPFVDAPSSRVRAEAVRALSRLDGGAYRSLLEAAVLDVGRVARVATQELVRHRWLNEAGLSALWGQAGEEQRARLVRLAARLPRFEAATLLLEWWPACPPGLQTWVEAEVGRRLSGFGTHFYTRPPEVTAARLRRAAVRGPASAELRRLVDRLVPDE